VRHILALTILALLLAGCDGNIASPTTTDYETTTTITTADMTQTHNRPVCVGLLNLGSCNTVAVQTINRPAGSPAPQPTGPTGAQTVGTLVLLCLAFVFVVGVAGAALGSGGYN
jgi:hypothetical protein